MVVRPIALSVLFALSGCAQRIEAQPDASALDVNPTDLGAPDVMAPVDVAMDVPPTAVIDVVTVDLTPVDVPSDTPRDTPEPMPCGSVSQRCCGGTACARGLICAEGVCAEACGGSDERCCARRTCSSGFVCADTTCVAAIACGTAGQPCCRGNGCERGTLCANGMCLARIPINCGNARESCCAGALCVSGTGCVDGICQTDCGSRGERCCMSTGRPSCEAGLRCTVGVCG